MLRVVDIAKVEYVTILQSLQVDYIQAQSLQIASLTGALSRDWVRRQSIDHDM
jgi:hypothetical protein